MSRDRPGEYLTNSIALGVIAGLVPGTFIGVTASALLAVKLGVAGPLEGIGLTMSLFIGSPGFRENPALLDVVKTGVFRASLMAGVTGYSYLYLVSRAMKISQKKKRKSTAARPAARRRNDCPATALRRVRDRASH